MTFSLKFIRKKHYNRQRKNLKENFGLDMDDWFKNPYSCLKARLYMEAASILVFIVQNTKVTPNFLSLIYVFLGATGGIFLASNNQNLILISLIVFFSKDLFDWSDGLLARLTKQTSELGGLLDNWGAQVGTYSFLCGFGIYLYNKNGEEYFAVLAIIIVLIKSLDLKKYAYENPSLNPKFIFAYPAYNLRNNEIGAIIGKNQINNLDKNILLRNENHSIFLEKINNKNFITDFVLSGQSNYAFNLIAKNPDKVFVKKLIKKMDNFGVEYRRGSAGGGNQLRQPYLLDLFPKNYFKNFPITEHVHFYGFYLGNYPSLKEEEILKLCGIINDI